MRNSLPFLCLCLLPSVGDWYEFFCFTIDLLYAYQFFFFLYFPFSFYFYSIIYVLKLKDADIIPNGNEDPRPQRVEHGIPREPHSTSGSSMCTEILLQLKFVPRMRKPLPLSYITQLTRRFSGHQLHPIFPSSSTPT